MTMNAPCYKCPDRKPNCHSACERYKAFAQEREEYKEKRNVQYDEQEFFYQEHKKVWLKVMKALNHKE